MEKELDITTYNNNFYGIKEDGSFDMEVFKEEPKERLAPCIASFTTEEGEEELLLLTPKKTGIFMFDRKLHSFGLNSVYDVFLEETGIELEVKTFKDAYSELQIMEWESNIAGMVLDDDDMKYALVQLVIDMYLEEEDLENLIEFKREVCNCDRCKANRAVEEN